MTKNDWTQRPRHRSFFRVAIVGSLVLICCLAFMFSPAQKPLIPHQFFGSPFTHFVILQRHAKSSWENLTQTDFERPLDDRGWQDAKRVGRYFADHTTMGGVWEQAGAPDLIACSSALRTRQTLAQWIDGFCFDKDRCQLNSETARLSRDSLVPVVYEPAIYEARNGPAMLDCFDRMPSDARTMLIVGHSTGLDEFLEILTGGPPAVKFSTCGMALLGSQLSGMGWKRPGTFWLLDYVSPSILD